MKKKINICYIDDRLDNMLSRYLDEYCRGKNNSGSFKYHLEFSEYTFESTDNYKTLLSNDSINRSNIIIVDSRLFENESSNLSKFTGEQFKIILRQVLPFIKTIVISQNASNSDSLTIRKFQATGLENNIETSQKYYEEKLAEMLKINILETIEEFDVLSQLELDNEVDSVLIGTIQSTIAGIQDTALFEKEDLDNLVKLFNEVKIKYGN
ncbi:hypothetical protein [Bacillus cereus]|uniref:hypothetical protein n=1 Tax=Bacillus cereus TaxID=1396 RepID=UPI000A20FC37|nr:Uncharacterized protein B5E38_0104 [Bacillus cereus]ARO67589.1 Uncharacterized protein B5E39_5454 [Bacillus cereus]HEB4953363.1 hypothetical protein [Bacillus cereus]